jgi:hypothetical protein
MVSFPLLLNFDIEYLLFCVVVRFLL